MARTSLINQGVEKLRECAHQGSRVAGYCLLCGALILGSFDSVRNAAKGDANTIHESYLGYSLVQKVVDRQSEPNRHKDIPHNHEPMPRHPNLPNTIYAQTATGSASGLYYR